MGDNFQIGGIEAKLTVDTLSFKQDIDESGKKLEKLYTQVNTLPPAIQKFQQQEERLTRQLEEQRQKIGQLYVNLDEAAASYAEMEKAMGRVGDVDLTKQFSKETAEIDKAEEKMQEYIQKLKLVEQQKQAAIEKMNASGVAALEKQQYKDNSIAIDSVANSLRGLTPLLGDTIGNVGMLAERLTFMKRSMDASASASAAMGAAISGGVTLGIAAVGMLQHAYEDMIESQRQAYQEAIASLADYEEQLRESAQAMSILDDQTSSVGQLTDARQRLADIFPELVLGYDKEGKAILAGNDALQKQINLLKQREAAQREIALGESGDVFGDYNNAGQYNPYEGIDWWEWAALPVALVHTGVNGIADEYNRIFKADLRDAENTIDKLDATVRVREKVSLTLEKQMSLLGELDAEQQVVASRYIYDTQEEILALSDKGEQTKLLAKRTEELKTLLSDKDAYKLQYDIIMSIDGVGDDVTPEMVANADKLADAIIAAQERIAKDEYEREITEIKKALESEYDDRKDALNKEYQAITDSISARKSAYQTLRFDMKTLDDDALADKIDLLNRRVAAEKDAQAKAILAVQERYYREAQLIMETASKEIKAHKDKLIALDEADRQADEARVARQNANKLRDLNESYAKQEAENLREMAKAEEAYEERRAALQAIIDNPATRTDQILAQRDLAELNKSWAEERESLEREHADKLLKIQRQLDEEKLIQSEDAAAKERDKEREVLNDKIKSAETAVEKQLSILNNQYAVEVEEQKKALDKMAAAEKKAYQNRLEDLKIWHDERFEIEEGEAKRRLEAALNEEMLTQKALSEIKDNTYEQLMEQAREFGLDFAAEAKSIGEQWREGLMEGMNGEEIYGPVYAGPLTEDSLRLKGFADGGIVSQPTLAWVGEGGEPEAVLPMSKLYDLVNGVLAGREAFIQRASNALYSRTGGIASHQVTNVVQVQNMTVRRDADIHLLSAELAAYLGRSAQW